jgi:uncharacterized repeat protein (TIGR03917 family)
VSNPHDNTQSATDLLPARAARRHRTPRLPTATTSPSAQIPHRAPSADDPRVTEPATRRTHPGISLAPIGAPHTLPAPPAPLADVVTVCRSTVVEHELVLTSGATAEDVTTAMLTIPPGATLVGHRAGTDLSLLFREPPDGTAGGHTAGAPS